MSSDETLSVTVERLHEENIQLEKLISMSDPISDSMTKDSYNHDSLIELLTIQNNGIRQALSSKEEEITILSGDPQNRIMIESMMGLETDIRALREENKLKEEYARHLQDEAKVLQSKIRGAIELKMETSQLKLDLENKERALKSYTALESKYKGIRKEHSELRLRYEKTVFDLDLANKDVAKLTKEYNRLINEYGVLFGDLK